MISEFSFNYIVKNITPAQRAGKHVLVIRHDPTGKNYTDIRIDGVRVAASDGSTVHFNIYNYSIGGHPEAPGYYLTGDFALIARFDEYIPDDVVSLIEDSEKLEWGIS